MPYAHRPDIFDADTHMMERPDWIAERRSVEVLSASAGSTALTRGVAALMMTGTVTLNRVAQDGVRVRASAGSNSFRRRRL